MAVNAKIRKIHARWVLDSRGNPAVEAEVNTKTGFSRAIVPSGASTGKYEAVELRDRKKAFLGKGVLKAIDNVEKKIAKKLKGKDVREQEKLDELMIELDKTENKSKLGANAILAVSLALTREAARISNEPLYARIGKISNNKKFWLPVPFLNVINGGKHAGNELDIQEFMIVPLKCKNFSQALQYSAEVYQVLKIKIKEEFGKKAINIGDEGGFAPPLENSTQALNLIMYAITELGYEKQFRIALDSAASEFYENETYVIEKEQLSSHEMIDYYAKLVENYPIISIEDPFAEDDWGSFIEFTTQFGRKFQILGDDLLVTNVERLQKAIDFKACNALLLKVNQIGTVSEAIKASQLARENKFNVMVSHRSGETEDTFISDLVVGLGSGQIKSGAPSRGERTAKYNQLLRIEEELGKKAVYAGKLFNP